MIGGMAMTETIELFVHISYTMAAQNFTDLRPAAALKFWVYASAKPLVAMVLSLPRSILLCKQS